MVGFVYAQPIPNQSESDLGNCSWIKCNLDINNSEIKEFLGIDRIKMPEVEMPDPQFQKYKQEYITLLGLFILLLIVSGLIIKERVNKSR